MLFVVGGLVSLIMTNQRQHIRESLKQEMVSSTRNFQAFLNDDLRNAGAILTLMHTGSFLKAPAPFNGILALNNADFPDGIILASGDQRGVTKLTADFSTGGTSLSVESVDYEDKYTGETGVAWAKDDVGLVMRENGFWVFRVTATPALGDTTIAIRAEPVYYSGLLYTDHYDDFIDDQLGTDGTGDYLADPTSPVVRLHYFHIYLTRVDKNDEGQDMNTLTITTDTLGESDLMGVDATDTIGIPLIENIIDFQIEYLTQDGFLWANADGFADPCPSPNSADCQTFRKLFVNRNLASLHVFLMTETELDRSITGNLAAAPKWDKPVMGDSPLISAQTEEKRRRIYYEFEIAPRNYRIVY
jgi:hypothetical protein